jgi:hypothetical protein
MLSITEVIGVYGAVVATGVFIWNIIKNRPRIKIEIWGTLDSKNEFDIFVAIINKSSYLFKVDFYGFDTKRNKVGLSPIYEEMQIPRRDQRVLHFGIDDIKLEFKNNEVYIFDTFFVVDRTGKRYMKRIPSYILEQAQITPIGKRLKIEHCK